MFKKSSRRLLAVAAALGALGIGTALADVPLPTVGGKIYADLTNIDEKEQRHQDRPVAAPEST